MAKDKSDVRIKEWAETFSAPVIAEIIKVLRAEEKRMGGMAKNELMATFVTGFVGSLMYNSLVEYHGYAETDKQQLEITQKNFAATKERLCEAVAQAFTAAMGNFSGRRVDYYCQVKPFPEPQNRLPA